ncbi:MAG: crosslink repair DNA glycosylase YcaQ family protein [Chloroflexota bacterium]|nr:crosslink repair DNA glycosylase YcaQ family protein [Chloroflexota bacterium]
MTIYPSHALQTVALHTQGLTTETGTTGPVDPDTLCQTIERIGCIQIDTLQMVHRSHYVILWSRLGSYDLQDLDRLAYDPEHRRLFEYWYHGASLIPLSEYRYRLPMMLRWRERSSDRYCKWLATPGNSGLQRDVLARIGEQGPLRAADFKDDGPRRNGWWDWKPAKRALEYLFNEGRLMVSNRWNFQRVFDLTERVLPARVDTHMPEVDETLRHVLSRSLLALGICQPKQLSDYTYDLKWGTARPYIEAMVAGGQFVEVEGRLSDGSAQALIAHRDRLSLLEQAADGALKGQRTTFLNPFDPLFYPGGRDSQFWGFEKVLEAYKPASQRRWGYFCLPILHGNQLVGRFDPKLERKTGTLRLKSLLFEPHVQVDDEMMAAIAAAMRDFLAFHQATDLVIERSQPADAGDRLLALV